MAANEVNDGGPAFPSATTDPLDMTVGPMRFTKSHGMSLRDWFAGQALVGILGSRNGFLIDCGTDNAADWAYKTADAMLAARSRGGAS